MHWRDHVRRKEIAAARTLRSGEGAAHIRWRRHFPPERAWPGLFLRRRAAGVLRNLPPPARVHAAGSAASARERPPRLPLGRARDSTKNPPRSFALRALSTGSLASGRQRNLRNSRTRDWRASASITGTSAAMR